MKPIDTAPHDRRVRVLCDDGQMRQLQFTAPHWWDAPAGQLRVADAVLYPDADTVKATHWAEP